MMRILPNDSLLRGVTISNVTAYLELLGWVRVEHPNQKLFVFQGPNDDFGDPLELFVPRHTEFIDSYRRLADIVNFLSAFEEIPARDVLRKISNFDRDVLYVRILDTGSYRSSIPLDIAHKQIGGIRELFAFSACSERIPRPYFNSMLSIGSQHSNYCQFGHTFDGSFGFTIESPIISPYQHVEGEESVLPFERRVMERIVRGLLTTQEALMKDDLHLLINHYPTAFNGNMCQAIVSMSNKKSVRIEWTISWSSKIKPSEDVKNPGPIRIENKYCSFLEAAAHRLRRMVPKKETVVGKVIQLRKRSDPLDYSSLPRTVVIRSNRNPGKADRIRVSLPSDEYRAATHAHKNGEPVTVRGVLEKVRNCWVLLDPVEFKLA